MARFESRPPKEHSRRRKRSLPRGLEQVNLHAAAIDVGANQHYVAVPPGASPDGADVREFGAFTQDLKALAEWLEQCEVTAVVLESTGVYWIPLYELLESRGFHVRLIDPRQAKRMPGRNKSDVLDCQWHQRLETFGLLTGAHRPPEQVCALRAIVRQRAMLVSCAAEHIQHMQKALTQMNIKLRGVLREVTGVTGMAIIRAILAGERDPQALAALRHRHCRNDEATIAKALEGTWREEHLFCLRHAVELYDAYQRHIDDCDVTIQKMLNRLPDTSQGRPLPPKPRRPQRRAEPRFDLRGALHRVAGVDLTRIEGIEANTALKILSETGADISPWPSEKHYGSWLGLCPGTKKSGGRILSSRSKPCANRAAAAYRLAAQSLWRSNSALGAFLRRKAAHRGMPKAITATAYKLARLVYAMLKHGTEYVVQSQQTYEALHHERSVRLLERRARSLGFALTQLPATTTPPNQLAPPRPE